MRWLAVVLCALSGCFVEGLPPEDPPTDCRTEGLVLPGEVLCGDEDTLGVYEIENTVDSNFAEVILTFEPDTACPAPAVVALSSGQSAAAGDCLSVSILPLERGERAVFVVPGPYRGEIALGRIVD